MALNRSNKYPGRFVPPTVARPQGAFKNRTSPTAQDGSYLEADWANDWDGFFARILNVAGVTPNGSVDDGTASQLYDALLTATPGRLLNARLINTPGLVTPTAGTKSVIAFIMGAGGAGGGTLATGASASSAGGGGASGSMVVARITNVSSLFATIGNGGIPVSGGNGGNGGNTSIGGFTAQGGTGGTAGSNTNPPYFFSGGGGTTPTAPGSIYTMKGTDGEIGLSFNTATAVSGFGGDCMFGTGGGRRGVTSAGAYFSGVSGTGYGGGGSGSVASANSPATQGGLGSNGTIYLMEYS